ncbi:MAG: hypothetical protein J1E36_00640 [Eubacterium sp.]|nr:hypothetical protein [Eubacterium sp.]
MTKIEEFENKIIEYGMSDKDFEEYKKLLKRCRDDFLKNQHCYITASKFKKENHIQAIKLINYGLENFVNDDWSSKMRAYAILSDIYLRIKDYDNAYKNMLMSDQLAEFDSYHITNSIRLLWIKLHLDKFNYSPEIEMYLNLYMKDSEFSKAFINHKFISNIAKIVINLKNKDIKAVKLLYEDTLDIISPNYKGALYSILKNHKYTEKVELTTEVKEYLEKISKIIN